MKRMKLDDLNYAKLKVIKPVPITLSTEEGPYVCVCAIFNHEYSSSFESDDVAIQTLKASLVELYYYLKQNQNYFGPHFHKIWVTMQEYIQEA